MRGIKIAGRLFSALLTGVLAVILACNLYTIAARQFLGIQQPAIFGYSSAIVVSGSMSGAIEIHDVVIVRHGAVCVPGDIIMFQSGDSLVTHRIVSEDGDAYITKGDANNTEDSAPTPQSSVLGKVVLVIPKVGILFNFLRTPFGLCLLVLLTIVSLLVPIF